MRCNTPCLYFLLSKLQHENVAIIQYFHSYKEFLDHWLWHNLTISVSVETYNGKSLGFASCGHLFCNSQKQSNA